MRKLRSEDREKAVEDTAGMGSEKTEDEEFDLEKSSSTLQELNKDEKGVGDSAMSSSTSSPQHLRVS